jgi:hypothetical protein
VFICCVYVCVGVCRRREEEEGKKKVVFVGLFSFYFLCIWFGLDFKILFVFCALNFCYL